MWMKSGLIARLFIRAVLCVFSFFFPRIYISWRLITLQYCSGFCHTLTWISHGFTCIPHPDPPSHLPLHPIPLGLPSSPALSTCLMHPTWTTEQTFGLCGRRRGWEVFSLLCPLYWAQFLAWYMICAQHKRLKIKGIFTLEEDVEQEPFK